MNKEELVLQHIGGIISARRKELGITQDQLAYIADIDRTYVGYIENGKQNVTVGMLCKIANALNLDIKQFFS